MIRWTQKTRLQLDKLVNRFNRKIDYYKKKGVKNLPKKIKRETIQFGVTDRKELNRKIESYELFLKKGAEKTIITNSGNEVTKYEYDREKKWHKLREKWKKKKLEEMLHKEVVIDGRKMGYTYEHPYADKSALAEYQPKEFPLDKKLQNPISKKMWSRFVDTFEQFYISDYDRNVNERYKANYIKALEKNNVSQLIIKKVKQTDCNEICRLLLENYLETKIDYVYPLTDKNLEKNQGEIDDRLYNFWVKGERELYKEYEEI